MRKRKLKPALLLCLSFLIPAIIILAALVGLKVTPYGDKTLAISDGHALYLNYLGYVARAVKGQEGILYSFTKGLGGNMMGSWGWFLLNPFFALFALFDITGYMQAFTYVSALNFCLCGLTMYLLLQDIYGHRTGNLIFSTAYAMNGFLTANVFQMNFFTGVPTLPLMALGLRKILKDKNPIVYILSLAYALLTNFYFGFMLCAASLLFFVVFFISERSQIEKKRAIVIKYILSSGFAGALSAFVWLPALLSLRGGRLDQSVAYAISFKENMPFLEMFSKLFSGANSTAELSNGLPNIFVGILPVFLLILFFMNQKIEKRKKTAAAVLLVFYLVSFYIPAFNIAMHGGTVTNWFNYRDSFVFCFLVLMIAAEEWRCASDEPTKHLRRAAAILIVVSLVVFSKRYEFVSGGAVLLDLVILALMLLAIRMHQKDPVKNPKRIMSVVVLLLMSVNLFLNYFFSTKSIMEWGKKESEYLSVILPVSALNDALKQTDTAFYRTEVGEQWSETLGNDPMLYGYFGVGHGGSDERDFVRTELNKLGIRRFDMRNSYGSGIPAATDSLLGLKYIISKDNLAEEKGYQWLTGLGDWSIYRNPYVLPIAVAANKKIDDITLDFEDIFANLNCTWSAMTGMDEAIFVEENDIAFETHSIYDSIKLTGEEAAEIMEERNAAKALQSTGDLSEDGAVESAESDSATTDSTTLKGSYDEPPEGYSYIEYTISVHRDGPVYSYNRAGLTDDRGSFLPTLFFEGCYHAGDTVTKYLPVSGAAVSKAVLEDVAGQFKVASVDMDVLAKLSEQLQNRPSELKKITDSHLTGTVTVENEQELLLTIPYDEGWTLQIDGKDAELKKTLGLFMAADIDPGSHVYELRFLPAGLKHGAGVSAIAILATVVYIPVDLRRRKRAACLPAKDEAEPST